MSLKKIIQSKKKLFAINIVLIVVLVFSLGINQILLSKITSGLHIKGGAVSRMFGSLVGARSHGSSHVDLTGNVTEDAIKLAISSGVPEIYGEELGITFDNVQGSIDIVKQLDPTYGRSKIILTGDNLQRYIDVGLRISCEYCCSAKSIITRDGKGACGCAHSWAMRGLIAYLVQNHGEEYTNDEILREISRWKAMYFPKQMIQKLSGQLQGANFTPDTASLILDIDLPDYGQGDQKAPLPSDITDLPSMVGGC
jgi:hypothetical protein